MANATADATQAPAAVKCCPEDTTLCRKCRPETGPTAAEKCCPDRTTRAVETVAETEAQLDRDRERHRAQRRVQPQPSLLEQPAVRHKWVPSIDTYLNWRWCNVSLAVRHFLACSYNLCSLLSVCDVIGLFLAQARPTDDCHLPSIHMAHERCTRTGVVMCVVYNVYGAACYTDQHVRTMHMHARVM